MPADLLGTTLPTPLGTLVALRGPAGLTAVSFDLEVLEAIEPGPPQPFDDLRAWLDAYFAKRFTELPPLALDLGPPGRERRVREAVQSIRPGSFWTYQRLAESLGEPNGARAVGTSLGRNPLAMVVPCHRVVPARGAWTQYRWGGSRKIWLLRHEGALLL